jgi:hypothetical protein
MRYADYVFACPLCSGDLATIVVTERPAAIPLATGFLNLCLPRAPLSPLTPASRGRRSGDFAAHAGTRRRDVDGAVEVETGLLVCGLRAMVSGSWVSAGVAARSSARSRRRGRFFEECTRVFRRSWWVHSGPHRPQHIEWLTEERHKRAEIAIVPR